MQTALAQESRDFVDHYWEKGYAIVRGFLDKETIAEAQSQTRWLYEQGMKHPYSYRHKNLLFEILPEAHKGRRYVLQAHWFSWINPFFEKLRRHPRYFEILSPLLGRDIKQVAQQIHWKPPGASNTGYRLHQDLRFREKQDAFKDIMSSYVTTGLAIDPSTPENGCLRVIPGSHKHGYLGLSDDGPIMKGLTQDEELIKAGLDPKSIFNVELEPGDLALWSLLTVHGSQPNKSRQDRALGISSYVKAANSERGEWAFRDGVSTPLGAEPEICKYEQLKEKPGPFYSDDKWYR